jgi:hypothetical protein
VENEDPDYIQLIEEFKKTGQIPITWQWSARQFICAANILRRRHEATTDADQLWNILSPMLLLYGLALELLLKALLVAQGVDATSAGVLNQKLITHNLLTLWRLAALPVNDATGDLLKRLHWSIEAGKYPVGKKPKPDDPGLIWVALTNIDDVGRLLEVVEHELRTLQPKRIFEKVNLLELCVSSTF